MTSTATIATKRKCPFCGSWAQSITIDDVAAHIACATCGARGQRILLEFYTGQAEHIRHEIAAREAVKAWEKQP